MCMGSIERWGSLKCAGDGVLVEQAKLLCGCALKALCSFEGRVRELDSLSVVLWLFFCVVLGCTLALAEMRMRFGVFTVLNKFITLKVYKAHNMSVEASYNSVKPHVMFSAETELAPAGKLPDGEVQLPFAFDLKPLKSGQPLIETYQGVFVNSTYTVTHGLLVTLAGQIMRSLRCRAVSDVVRRLLILGGVEENPGPPCCEHFQRLGASPRCRNCAHSKEEHEQGNAAPPTSAAPVQQLVTPVIQRPSGGKRPIPRVGTACSPAKQPIVQPTGAPEPTNPQTKTAHVNPVAPPPPPETLPPRVDAALPISVPVIKSATELKQIFNETRLVTSPLVGKDVVVYFGTTGAGKTTQLRFIIGHDLRIDTVGGKQVICGDADERFTIGHEASQTRTVSFADVTHNGKTLWHADLPGDNDTDRTAAMLLRNFLLKAHVLQHAASVRFVLMLKIDDFGIDRGANLPDMIEPIACMFADVEEAWKSMSVFVCPITTCGLHDLGDLRKRSESQLLGLIAGAVRAQCLPVLRKSNQSEPSNHLALLIAEEIARCDTRSGHARKVYIANPVDARGRTCARDMIYACPPMIRPAEALKLSLPSQVTELLYDLVKGDVDECVTSLTKSGSLRNAAKLGLEALGICETLTDELHVDASRLEKLSRKLREVIQSSWKGAWDSVVAATRKEDATLIKQTLENLETLDRDFFCEMRQRLRDLVLAPSRTDLRTESLEVLANEYIKIDIPHGSIVTIQTRLSALRALELIVASIAGCAGGLEAPLPSEAWARDLLHHAGTILASLEVNDRASPHTAACHLARLRELCTIDQTVAGLKDVHARACEELVSQLEQEKHRAESALSSVLTLGQSTDADACSAPLRTLQNFVNCPELAAELAPINLVERFYSSLAQQCMEAPMKLEDVGDRNAVEQHVRTAEMLIGSGNVDLARRGNKMLKDLRQACKEASKRAAKEFLDAIGLLPTQGTNERHPQLTKPLVELIQLSDMDELLKWAGCGSDCMKSVRRLQEDYCDNAVAVRGLYAKVPMDPSLVEALWCMLALSDAASCVLRALRDCPVASKALSAVTTDLDSTLSAVSSEFREYVQLLARSAELDAPITSESVADAGTIVKNLFDLQKIEGCVSRYDNHARSEAPRSADMSTRGVCERARKGIHAKGTLRIQSLANSVKEACEKKECREIVALCCQAHALVESANVEWARGGKKLLQQFRAFTDSVIERAQHCTASGDSEEFDTVFEIITSLIGTMAPEMSDEPLVAEEGDASSHKERGSLKRLEDERQRMLSECNAEVASYIALTEKSVLDAASQLGQTSQQSRTRCAAVLRKRLMGELQELRLGADMSKHVERMAKLAAALRFPEVVECCPAFKKEMDAEFADLDTKHSDIHEAFGVALKETNRQRIASLKTQHDKMIELIAAIRYGDPQAGAVQCDLFAQHFGSVEASCTSSTNTADADSVLRAKACWNELQEQAANPCATESASWQSFVTSITKRFVPLVDGAVCRVKAAADSVNYAALEVALNDIDSFIQAIRCKASSVPHLSLESYISHWETVLEAARSGVAMKEPHDVEEQLAKAGDCCESIAKLLELGKWTKIGVDAIRAELERIVDSVSDPRGGAPAPESNVRLSQRISKAAPIERALSSVVAVEHSTWVAPLLGRVQNVTARSSSCLEEEQRVIDNISQALKCVFDPQAVPPNGRLVGEMLREVTETNSHLPSAPLQSCLEKTV